MIEFVSRCDYCGYCAMCIELEDGSHACAVCVPVDDEA